MDAKTRSSFSCPSLQAMTTATESDGFATSERSCGRLNRKFVLMREHFQTLGAAIFQLHVH